MLALGIVFIFITKSICSSIYIEFNDTQPLNYQYGGNITGAIYDIVNGFPLNDLTIVFDASAGDVFINKILSTFYFRDISVLLFNITKIDQQEEHFNHLQTLIDKYHGSLTLYFCSKKMLEFIMIEIQERNYIRRNLIYAFYRRNAVIDEFDDLSDILSRMMKIIIITNPRYNVYRLYYNQANSSETNKLKLINWWIDGAGLYQHPTLPNPEKVFKNFNQRVIEVPVLHKPPWHFVKYSNDSLQVLGGRDHKLLLLLSQKLHFKYEYVDPPERSQGTSFNTNGSFEGVLGLIWKREAEFFLGDVALTSERSQVVEFSFLTLADSGAFVTHAPNKLNEAFSLIRPFQWEVWPAIIFTVLISGPVLFLLIAAPNLWHPEFIVKSYSRLLFDCIWYTTRLFLKQTGKEPSSTHKVRFFIIIIYLSATYVISDMYSANLTSLLARPGREKAINNLVQLEKAMKTRGYKLYVEHHSSSYSLLENGTGVYGRLWETMNTKQASFLVDSVEEGVKMVKERENTALIAGRETLYFDTQRFGYPNFHLSEKLNTAYSAIALQLGCPYIENFNKILMAIFEAGILTKMTQNEYEQLEKQETYNVNDETVEAKKEMRKAGKENEKLEPINIKMLQGAFYLLLIGYFFSGISLGFELYYYRNEAKYRRMIRKRTKYIQKKKRRLLMKIRRRMNKVKRRFRNMFNDAIIRTLEYVE